MSVTITNTASDKELIIEIKESSQNALKLLFFRYNNKLIDLCLYRSIDLDTSKDFVQEIFTSLWISRGKLDPEKSIKSYLYKSITNKIINHAKHSSSKTITLDESFSHNIDTNNNKLEISIDLYSAIEKLPEKLKQIPPFSIFVHCIRF